MSAELAETLFRGDWRSAGEVARTSTTELATVPGIGSVEAAAHIIEAAVQADEIEKARLQAEREAAAAMAAQAPPVEEHA